MFPTSNCSYTTASTPARRSAHAVARPFTPAPTTATSANGVPQESDPLDLELDHVAALEPPPVAELEDAASPHRPGTEHVAREEAGIARCMLDDLRPGE